MLEARINVIDSRVTDIDRSDKNVILHDGKVVPYDTLILTMGIQDQTLAADKLKHISQGISSNKHKMRQCNGVLSIDDPYLYKYLGDESPLLNALTDRRRTSNCVIYGRTLNTYALIQGLLNRGVRPSSIILCIPEASCHIEEYDQSDPIMQEDLPVIYPNAFEDENIEMKIQSMLEEMGITIYKQVKLIQIITDKEKDKPEAKHQGIGSLDSADSDEENVVVEGANLERLLFKKLNEVDDEEEEDEDDDENRDDMDGDSNMGGMTADDNSGEEDRSDMEGGHHEKKKRRKKNELELEARVLVTCGHCDVDPDVFDSIHENGLVYNGRLIVDRHF